MNARFESSAIFAACPSETFPTSKSLTASRSLASSSDRLWGSSIRSSVVAIRVSFRRSLERSWYMICLLQPEIPPHLPVLQIEHHHPPAVVGDGEVLRGQAEGGAGRTAQGDLGAHGGARQVDEVEEERLRRVDGQGGPVAGDHRLGRLARTGQRHLETGDAVDVER